MASFSFFERSKTPLYALGVILGCVQKIFSAQHIFSFIQSLGILKRVRNPLKSLVNLSRMDREAKGEASKRWVRETGRVTEK